MATYTENYNMVLTEADDVFDIEDYNGNFETIDTLMAEQETAMQEVNEKLGTPEEGETIFSLLKNNGNSLVKSIQRIIVEPTEEVNNQVIEITPVNASRSIVIMETLMNHSNFEAPASNYTLYDSYIAFSMSVYGANKIRLGFWIIEFN